MTARRAEGVTLAVDASLADVVLAVTEECMAHWRANVDGVLVEHDVESLHQLRVGVRRFRSSLSLLGRPLDDPYAAWLNAEIRELALPFGTGRDLDVVLGDCAADLEPAALGHLRERRAAAYEEITAILGGERWAGVWQLVERFRAHVRTGASASRPARPATDEALERRWRRVLDRGSRVPSLSARDRHRVRIEAKKLRYGAQFFAGLHPRPTPDPGVGPLEFADLVAELQGTLGELNDAHTRRLILHSVDAPSPPFDEDDVIARSMEIHARLSTVEPFWHDPSC